MEAGTPDLFSLLNFLRERLGSSALSYTEPPVELQGGFESRVYAFTLTGAPSEFERPLVLRVLQRLEDPQRARREAVIHNTVAEHGFPAPRVLIAVSTLEELGAPFLIMQRVPGTTMLSEFQGLGLGRSSAELIRLLVRMPWILWKTTLQLAETQARLHRLPGDILLRTLEREGLDAGAVAVDTKFSRMFDTTARGPLSYVHPAVTWLIDNRPPHQDPTVICHGDFQPFNILVRDGQVTGVIDWANTTVAEPALDVGFTVGSFVTVPVSVPQGFRQLVYASMRAARLIYERSYRRLAPLSVAKVRYYEAARCVSELVWMGSRIVNGDARTGAYQSLEGVRRLTKHLRDITGVEVRFPFEV